MEKLYQFEVRKSFAHKIIPYSCFLKWLLSENLNTVKLGYNEQIFLVKLVILVHKLTRF